MKIAQHRAESVEEVPNGKMELLVTGFKGNSGFNVGPY